MLIYEIVFRNYINRRNVSVTFHTRMSLGSEDEDGHKVDHEFDLSINTTCRKFLIKICAGYTLLPLSSCLSPAPVRRRTERPRLVRGDRTVSRFIGRSRRSERGSGRERWKEEAGTNRRINERREEGGPLDALVCSSVVGPFKEGAQINTPFLLRQLKVRVYTYLRKSFLMYHQEKIHPPSSLALPNYLTLNIF